MAQAFAGKPNTFITLTASPDQGDSPEDRARRLVAAWRVIVKEAKAKYGYPAVPYLCVFEATKKGEPHLHIITRVPWISQAWLSRRMADLTGSPVCWVTRVKKKSGIAAYVAKYVGKDPHRFEGTKRYWRTMDWMLDEWTPPDPPGRYGKVWEIRSHTLTYQEEAWEILGWRTWRCRGVLYGTGNDPPF